MIKEKLSQGTFFYKLYLYYQLLFRYKLFYRRNNYSQFDEDLFLIEFFKNNRKGTFVDLGAFHPIRYNNTYLLYKKGWRGINIDLNQTSIDMFNIARKNDVNRCALLSDVRNLKKTVYFEHNFSAANSMTHKKGLDIKKEMKTEIFDDIVTDKFDFLNIDLEGQDYKVLKSINFKKHKPRLICIEILEKSEDKNKIFNFMEEKNYKFIKTCNVSYFFEKNESN
tara:strand:- start:9793 stop:10461 length:669 start_codon:yes stop_codon:yes gene_type:complete